MNQVMIDPVLKVKRAMLGVTFCLHVQKPSIGMDQDRKSFLFSGLKRSVHVEPGRRVTAIRFGYPAFPNRIHTVSLWWSAAVGDVVFAFGCTFVPRDDKVIVAVVGEEVYGE